LICEESVPIHDDNIATHLYRIAQEAINNAIKHGQPTQIDIELVNLPDGVGITITDNGVGIPPNVGSGRGMGLRIMNYRANMIGGTLEVTRGPKGGTVVTCHVLSAVGESPAGSV
jgi:two-component system CheB/CheR fusion protein